MFLLWAVILGVLIGFLRKGSLKNLSQLKLHGTWLILVALVIQLLIFPLGARKPLIGFGTEYLHILSYLLLLAFVFLNRRYWQIILMGLGMLSNFLVILANGGHMPATEAALRGAGLNRVADRITAGNTSGNIILMSEDTKLNFLGDIMYMPSWVPLANAFSLGDLLLGLGIILFLQEKMAFPARKESA